MTDPTWEALREYLRWRKALLATDERRSPNGLDAFNRGRKVEIAAVQDHMRKLTARRQAERRKAEQAS